MNNVVGNNVNALLYAASLLGECENEKVKDIEDKRDFILISGICVISISLLILIVFFVLRDIKKNKIWNLLYRNVKSQSRYLQKIAIERLKTVHDRVEMTDDYDIEEFQSLNKKTIQFSELKVFFVKIIPLFTIFILSYFMYIFVYYEYTKDMLNDRNIFLSAFSKLFFEINWIRYTNVCNQAHLMGYTLYPSYQNISLIYSQNYTDHNKLSQLATFLADPNFETIRSKNLLSKIIERDTITNNTYLWFGLYSAIQSINQDISYYSTSECSKISYENLKLNFKDLEEIIIQLEDTAYNDARKFIESEIMNLTALTVVLSISAFFLSLFIYFRMISRDIQRVNCIKVVLDIFPHK